MLSKLSHMYFRRMASMFDPVYYQYQGEEQNFESVISEIVTKIDHLDFSILTASLSGSNSSSKPSLNHRARRETSVAKSAHQRYV